MSSLQVTARTFDVTIHSDGSLSIRDNGRGIPVDINKEEGIPGVELVLTRLHSGGKYGQGNYEYSGGTHGVGAKCVNAVSEWFKVEVTRDGKIHAMSFERGETKQKLHVIAEVANKRHTGTLITFKPDPEIFLEITEYKAERILTRLHDLAYINAPLSFTFLDERTEGARADSDSASARCGGFRGKTRGEQDAGASEANHDQGHAGSRDRGDRAALQRQLQRTASLLHECGAEPRWWHAFERIPGIADARD
jgi:DNA gyrase/topoisomerase IV subunit B